MQVCELQYNTSGADLSDSAHCTRGMSRCCRKAVHFELHVHRIWVFAQQCTSKNLPSMPIGSNSNNNHIYNNSNNNRSNNNNNNNSRLHK
mmetsp:Transcript_129930/g.211562  ORF Transcript_129930/g.211562 Transcript_129930/m.211562 type:complete len:90 (+) Transcript_129930:996-1265(+)